MMVAVVCLGNAVTNLAMVLESVIVTPRFSVEKSRPLTIPARLRRATFAPVTTGYPKNSPVFVRETRAHAHQDTAGPEIISI